MNGKISNSEFPHGIFFLYKKYFPYYIYTIRVPNLKVYFHFTFFIFSIIVVLNNF